MKVIRNVAPDYWPKDMRDDFNYAMARDTDDELKELCVVCGRPVTEPGSPTSWYVAHVDAWGETLWQGYACSSACFRRTPPKART